MYIWLTEYKYLCDLSAISTNLNPDNIEFRNSVVTNLNASILDPSTVFLLTKVIIRVWSVVSVSTSAPGKHSAISSILYNN